MVSMASPQKHPKSGVYYLRKSIPEKLRPVFGKREFYISLRTKDPKIAKERHLEELARVEALIREAERGPPVYSVKEAKALAGVWLRKALEEDEHYIRFARLNSEFCIDRPFSR